MACILALGAAPLASGAEPVTEIELVRRTLQAPVAAADIEAVEARTRADRTGVSLLESPALQARHEAARGDWGATTNAVGASVTVDLGLSPLGLTRAARLRGSAGDQRVSAVVLELMCAVRADATELWSANQSAVVTLAAQERLDDLQGTISALAEAGEASGYDRDRTALAVGAHQTATAAQVGIAEQLRAGLTSLTGGEAVSDVTLADLPDVPEVDRTIVDLASHPVLEALSLQRDAEKASRDAARLGQLPDLTVSGGSRWDAAPTGGPATQGFEVGGALQIPWMDGGRAEAREQAAAYSAAEARLERATAELEAQARGAHQRLRALDDAPAPASSDPERVWEAAKDRYAAGESSLDDLLQIAEAVEAARLAEVERERLRRRARLDLSCATGRFAATAFQSVLEEAVR